jgi:nucleotide-binding universal stress UspA family protein
MRSILVPTGGSDTDEQVLATALAVARPLSAHLRFVHFRISPGQAAIYTPHVAFARGPAIADALGQLQEQGDTRSAAAARHVSDFCAHAGVDMVDVPRISQAPTASWREEEDDPRRRLLFHARHSDLVIMGRSKRPNGLPPDLVELLLMGCGRPLLLTGTTAPRNLTGIIMVCWRDTADAARAVTAATPLLTRATRVVFAAVNEGRDDNRDSVQEAASQFRWNGVATTAESVAANGRPPAEVLASLAKSCGADLMVMGAYGRSRTRELIFGGCTQAVLRQAELPVFLLH